MKLLKRYGFILPLVVVILVTWLPRGIALNRYVTTDEAAWVGRSANFFYSLVYNKFGNTFQQSHPGVTAMWAGALAYRQRYNAVAVDAKPYTLKNFHRLEMFIRAHGVPAIVILETARKYMVLGTTIALAFAFLMAYRLLGLVPAVLGCLLIAFDPFHIGLTRLLHLDGLLSSLIFLAVLSYLCYEYRGRHWEDLIIATLASGLAWLTKSPGLFLVPFIGLISSVQLWHRWRERRRFVGRDLWNAAWPFVFLVAGSALLFVLLWPVMWVNPLGTLSQMFNQTSAYAVEGHEAAIFFNGKIYDGDPGWIFYPVNYLWRTTPVTLIGLCLMVLAFVLSWSPANRPDRREILLFMASYGLLFGVMMTLGAKKFDRYIIPSFPPFDFLAGIGWAALAVWLWKRRPKPMTRWFVAGLLALAIGWQLTFVVRTYPYYLTYYNPLLGGIAKAPKVMQIGWGEGLDQAARYLNTLPGADEMKVMSYYPDGSFSYFFNGETEDFLLKWNGINSTELQEVDYLVLYFHQWQRQVPDPAMLEFFNKQVPEYIVTIDGIDYAKVYNLDNLR